MNIEIDMCQPNREQLLYRLPEIKSLDGRVQSEVISLFIEEIPPYFWLARSSEDYHPPDERGLGGLWLHTKRVYTAFRILEPTYKSLNLMGPYQANCARAAVLLHDAFKYGQHPSTRSSGDDMPDDAHDYAHGLMAHLPAYTMPDHDTLMAEHITTETELPDEVAWYVAAHGGSGDWYGHEGPSPDSPIEMVVHLADMIATSKHHKLPVYEPTTELRSLVGDDALPVIDDESWISTDE